MAKEPAPRSTSDLPHRDVTDPDILRAVAHPLRMRLLDALAQYGPATATELARCVGDTQPNCSWHLRQLRQFGLIEEAEGGKGRQRPWQLVKQSVNVDVSRAGEASAAGLAATGMAEMSLKQNVEALRHWRSIRHEDDAQWTAAAGDAWTWAWLTAEELAAFTSELQEVVDRHVSARLDRVDHTRRPPGSRAVRHVSWSIPAGADTETPDDSLDAESQPFKD